MKSKCSFILKASTSLVLALLMLFGTVASSFAAVVDHADVAEDSAEDSAFFANVKKHLDLADTGAQADLAETGYSGWKIYGNAKTGSFDSSNELWSGSGNSGTAYIDCSNIIGSNFEFKLVCEGTWCGTTTTAMSLNTNRTFSWNSGFNAKYKVTKGILTITVSDLTVKITQDQSPSVYLYGDGISGGNWTNKTNSDYKMTQTSGSDVFTKTVTMKGGAKRYFRAFKDYDSGTEYGRSDTDTALTNGSSSFVSTANSTSKAFYVDLTNYGTTSDDISVTITLDLSAGFKASWAKKTYTVSYNKGSNGTGTNTTATKTYGTALTLKGAIFTRTGYTQTAWNTNSSGTGGTSYALSGSYTANAAVTLYPTWTQNTYAITLSETGGSGTMKIDGTTRSSGYAVTHGSHSFSVTAPSGYIVQSISGIGTWSDVGTQTATLGSTSITAAETITVTYAADNKPTLGSLSDQSKTVNDTTFDVTGTIDHASAASGTLSATASSGTTTVATVGTPTVSGSTVTIPVTVKGPGTSTVTVILKDGSTTMNSQTFDVTVAEPTFSITNKTIQAHHKDTTACTVTNGGTTPSFIAWSSGTPANVTVNASTGKLTAKKINSSSVITATATYACGYTKNATATVTVDNPTVTVASTATTGIIGDTATASATGTKPTLSATSVASYLWSTSDASIIGISDTSAASPTLNFKKAGTATIKLKVTYNNNSLYKESATVSITVTDASITMSNTAQTVAIGDTYTRTATGSTLGSEATGSISYSSSDTTKATVNATTGEVTGVAAGTSTITATYTVTCGGQTTTKTASYTVTVAAPSLTVKDGSTSVINGTVYTTKNTNKTLTVGTNFSDTLYVKSSNESIATVSLSGTTLTITPKAKGTTTVTVSTSNTAVTSGRVLAETAASMPNGFMRKIIELAVTSAVATQTAQFTVNVAEADTYHYVYFSNGDNWNSPVIHAWGANGTPADRAAMTKIGVNNLSQDVYAYRFSATDWAKVQNIHFLSSASATWSDSSNADNTHTFTGTELSHNGFYNDGTYDLTLVKPQIQADNVTIDMGSTKTMTATVLTQGTPSTYNWSSGTTSVATTANTHTASNVITGVAPGSSTITIKAYAAKPTGWTSIVTDGTADNFVAGTTTATATVVAENKTITNNGAYYKTGSAAYASGNTGGTFSVSQTGSLAYNTNITLTATAASGYAVEGIYWSTNGTTWTKVTTTDTKANGYVTKSVYDSFKVTDNFRLKAQFVQVLKLSAFDSYEMKNSQVTFVTAPPKSITIKHTDADGEVTTYTYSYSGTAPQGNPDSPDTATTLITKPAALPIASGTYGQGNYIQYYAGDEITLTYSAMASSELLKGVFYNNSENFWCAKPTSSNFVAHSHPSTPAIYMNSAYYTTAQINSRSFSDVTVDNDAHSVKFTGTQDYKNIDVEIGTKRKVYFSDYTNAVITSKNTDDYYYDSEQLSVTGDQLTVAAKMSATQTNKIVGSGVKFYKATESGGKGTELTSPEITSLGLSVTNSTSTSTSSANGTALVISGKMPAYDLYIDLNMQNSYTLKLGTLVVSSLGESGVERLRQKANTISIAGTTTLNASTTAKVTTDTTSVNTGSSATLTVSGITSGYMFVGWYWGDDTAPDYDKGFISDKQTLGYTPKKGGIIWAVGTKELFINGSKYITGKSYASGVYWNQNSSGVWQNLRMEFDPSRGTKGSYYWEITDTMFEAAGSEFKTWKENNANTTYGSYYKGGDNYYYWANNSDNYHGKAYFQFLDTETGSDNKGIWWQVLSFEEAQEGATYGKIYPQGDDYDWKRNNGQGFINFNESNYPGYSSPIRIYLDADTKDLDVRPTPIYSDLYVSNGYDVGSTVKTDAVTVEPVVDGVVKTSGQTGYFDVNNTGVTYSPDAEGTVTKYSPKKKGATIRITKKAGGSDKIAAFLIYDLDAKTVHAEKNVKAGTASGGKTPYYIDYTLANEKQRLYIVPIVEEAGAKVTITFDATQLNRTQWGDIVTAYAWYNTTNAPALGAYPGQPMIPSDDMSTWTTSFNPVKGSHELDGITFSNYVDGIHSWLGTTGSDGIAVMGSEVNSGTQSISTSGGIITQYNIMKDTDWDSKQSVYNGTYNKANFKAQTYDYHEPIALYDRYKSEDTIDITFQMKDGNSSLISWRHHEFSEQNILNLPSDWTPLRWEYLTNAKGDKYVDMNGNEMTSKPSATFYVASKGLAGYSSSTLSYVFHGGHDYEMKGYTGTYNNGSYSRTALSSWSTDITYGGVNGLNMSYGVQWYVYDAQGNYITTVLSAGIADLSSNRVDTYIGKTLEDMGYAVDGKSVAICYDKPRYMYTDSTVTNSANNKNSGTNFDAYRFEGQWIANASSAMTRVNVEVAMMTDNGEVLANSRVAGYGHAEASFASGVTLTKAHNVAGDNSWAETATSEAKLNAIELTATKPNFIGWYYYDANTGEFTKATYSDNVGFRPSYSTKDVTFYAVYKASAIYNFIYTGREGERTYSVAGNSLTQTEMDAGPNQYKVQYSNHESDILSKIPSRIGVFKKTLTFNPSTVESSTKDNSNAYILNMSGFTPSSPSYTLMAYYKKANGKLVYVQKSAEYNGDAVDLTAGAYTDSESASKPAGTAVTSYYDKKFLGWYEYNGSSTGALLSTQHNFGMRLTKNQSIIAVYDETGSTTRPEDSESWKVYIDENEINKELTSPTSGFFYNDTIVRVRKGSDVTATLPSGYKIGVLLITKPSGATKEANSYTPAQLLSLVGAVDSGKTMTAKSGLRITNMQATTQTNFNRTDIAVRADFAKTNGAEYCVYAYFYDGSEYHFSEASAVKTYE